eukprot:5610772-Amphidinium_carterae.1
MICCWKTLGRSLRAKSTAQSPTGCSGRSQPVIQNALLTQQDLPYKKAFIGSVPTLAKAPSCRPT